MVDMVVNATSLSRNGLTDFLIQRITAIVLGLYTGCIVAYLLFNPATSYESWVGFFQSPPMQIFGTLALLSLCGHAWIGMWTVGTDYLNVQHFGTIGNLIRWFYQLSTVLVLAVFLICGLRVIW